MEERDGSQWAVPAIGATERPALMNTVSPVRQRFVSEAHRVHPVSGELSRPEPVEWL